MRFDVGDSGWACKSNCSIGLDQGGPPLEKIEETVYWQGSGVDSFVEDAFGPPRYDASRHIGEHSRAHFHLVRSTWPIHLQGFVYTPVASNLT